MFLPNRFIIHNQHHWTYAYINWYELFRNRKHAPDLSIIAVPILPHQRLHLVVPCLLCVVGPSPPRLCPGPALPWDQSQTQCHNATLSPEYPHPQWRVLSVQSKSHLNLIILCHTDEASQGRSRIVGWIDINLVISVWYIYKMHLCYVPCSYCKLWLASLIYDNVW